MQKLLKKKVNKEKGFTLIELIVVIAIIAILAAILLPKYFGFTDDARKNAAISEAKNIWSIEQTDYAKTGSWPTIKTASGIKDDATNEESTITLGDKTTVYTFDGVLTPTADPTDGSFTYKKWNGKTTSKLWTATCDSSGNITIAQGS